MRSFIDYDIPALAASLGASGLSPSHAVKLLRAYYRSVEAPDLILLKVGARAAAWAESELAPIASRVAARSGSADGTIKLLMELGGGGAVESVLMPSHRPDRAAGCVSSQVGCAMGCDFCASTRGGLDRNLAAREIVEQFLHLKDEAAAAGRRLTSLVFMGMGEPMHNLDNVTAAIRRIADPNLGALGWRQITVSTVGIVPGIDRLADADLNVHLALSLHAPDDATRASLVPANRRYPVDEIMSAARRFAARTGRVSTIEYCMLAGVNDSDEQADRLAELMRGFRAHVNLIPYNAIGAGISGRRYERSSPQRQAAFLSRLRAAGVVAHLRETRGDDVAAACGQLRRALVAPVRIT